MEAKILEVILKGKQGKKIEVVTDKSSVEGTLKYVDVHGNILLENEKGHTVFIQRAWIQTLTILEDDEYV